MKKKLSNIEEFLEAKIFTIIEAVKREQYEVAASELQLLKDRTDKYATLMVQKGYTTMTIDEFKTELDKLSEFIYCEAELLMSIPKEKQVVKIHYYIK